MAETEAKPKIFNDSIHGYIEMPPLCVAIIDTPQFQRLRSIKQMGGTYFVYPGASHNRFEHSIGTSYLAGYFVESLKRKQGELNIDKKDVLCVKIAGLCHDLGHGPFSHMFDNDFIPQVSLKNKGGKKEAKKWTHEDASKKMFDHLIESNKNVEDMFKKFELNTDADKNFIKRLMTGETPKSEEEWGKVGRQEKKPRFLFEIVANKINGIDVDKWDYFARDCRYLGIKSSFDHMRCIQLAKVIDPKDEKLPQISFRDSAVGNIYDLFNTRLSIHKKACQHKTGNAIETMITEALVKANSYHKIKGENGDKKKMSEAIFDMYAYTKLTDHVYYDILYFDPPEEDQDEDIAKDPQSVKGQTDPAEGEDQENIAQDEPTDPVEGEDHENENIAQDEPTDPVEGVDDENENIAQDEPTDPVEGEDHKNENLAQDEPTDPVEGVDHENENIAQDEPTDPAEGEDQKKNLAEMIEAREILKKIEKRELYKFIGYTIPKDVPSKEGVPAMKNEIFDIVKSKGAQLEKDDIVVQLTSFSYGGGMDNKNPGDKVLFYSKDDEKKSFKIKKNQVSNMLPKVFFEKEIRVYCKKREPEALIDDMKSAFDSFCEQRGYENRFYSYVDPEPEEENAAA